jgi:hypothetical protein
MAKKFPNKQRNILPMASCATVCATFGVIVAIPILTGRKSIPFNSSAGAL